MRPGARKARCVMRRYHSISTHSARRSTGSFRPLLRRYMSELETVFLASGNKSWREEALNDVFSADTGKRLDPSERSPSRETDAATVALW